MSFNYKHSKMPTLPKTSFFFFPLYLGVELILGICVLNKCSGFYGILALFTGHPLSSIQWLTYIWSIFTLIVYTQGLFHISNPNVYTFSQIFTIFSLDTIFTFLVTIYFSISWFGGSHEYKGLASDSRTQEDIELSKKQGASTSYELFLVITMTVMTLIARLYYNVIIASFVQKLFFSPKFVVDRDEIEQDFQNKNKFKKFWWKFQKICFNISSRILK